MLNNIFAIENLLRGRDGRLPIGKAPKNNGKDEMNLPYFNPRLSGLYELTGVPPNLPISKAKAFQSPIASLGDSAIGPQLRQVVQTTCQPPAG